MDEKTEYPIKLNINGVNISHVLIRQYYKKKHPDVTDQIILALIKTLHRGHFPIVDRKTENGCNYEFFVVEPVFYNEKPYRLVLVLCVGDDFLGVVNAFRRPKK